MPDGTQTGYLPTTAGVVAGGTEFGLVGEKYGWLVEIDPDDSEFRVRKHTALGRFRHENITLRVERGQKLVAYMGDDRRGGHTWKFVSQGDVLELTSIENSKLLEQGTLYVARYNADGTGRWIPLLLARRRIPIDRRTLHRCRSRPASQPERLPRSRAAAASNRRGRSGARRRIVCVRTQRRSSSVCRLSCGLSGAHAGYLLSDAGRRALRCIPRGQSGRRHASGAPEDLEVNPHNPREVFIAFTDGAPAATAIPTLASFKSRSSLQPWTLRSSPGGCTRSPRTRSTVRESRFSGRSSSRAVRRVRLQPRDSPRWTTWRSIRAATCGGSPICRPDYTTDSLTVFRTVRRRSTTRQPAT